MAKASKGRNPLADAYQLPTAATVGFASTSSRFSASEDKNAMFTPAPGEYQQTSMVNELDKSSLVGQAFLVVQQSDSHME